MSTLFNLEKKFKLLVEDKIVNLFIHKKLEDLISRKLASAMYDQIQSLESGKIHAPNFFLVTTSPANALEIRNNTYFLHNLATALDSIGQEAGFTYLSKIIISTHADKTFKGDEVKVIASFFKDKEDETRGIQIKSNNIQKEEQKRLLSCLILEDNNSIPLELQVTNLGRRPANQVVLNDPRISRDHAQIREINGRYKIFDLNSKGGTFINDLQIKQNLLESGDVISLAGYSIIFIQDSMAIKNEIDETAPLNTD